MSKRKKSVVPYWVYFLIALSVALVGFGILQSYLHWNDDKFIDSNLIGAIFSLAGVVMFATALFYQIQEYKAQIIELQNTVRAQQDSVSELKEQKNLMLIQQTQDQIFKVIENFNSVKNQSQLTTWINSLWAKTKTQFSDFGNKKPIIKIYSNNTFSEIVDKIRLISEKEINNSIIDFIHFVDSIIILINEKDEIINKSNKYDFFMEFFIRQFSSKEKTVLFVCQIKGLGINKSALFDEYFIELVLSDIEILQNLNLTIEQKNELISNILSFIRKEI